MTDRDTQDTHEPVVVFATSRDDDMALAKSMLQSADIPFFTRNEMTADLLGWGRIGGGNLVTGPMEILVARRDGESAYELLAGLREGSDGGKHETASSAPSQVLVPPEQPVNPEGSLSSSGFSWRVFRMVLFVVIVFLGIAALVFLISR